MYVMINSFLEFQHDLPSVPPYLNRQYSYTKDFAPPLSTIPRHHPQSSIQRHYTKQVSTIPSLHSFTFD